MSKIGKEFELAVSDVVREMDPNSIVRQGMWVDGPDGSRDLDIIIEGTVDGVAKRIQIECKDYNPNQRPLGIGFVDALDSKHRDLRMDVSLLCSNAGFTADAVRKAKRLGIGLIGVLREHDQRIRYKVFDEIYIRRINIVPGSEKFNFNFVGQLPPQGNMSVEEVKFAGLPVTNWLIQRVKIFLGSNQVVKGVHELRFRFKRPVEFSLPFGRAVANDIGIQFEISGGWFAQTVEIDATCGLYDWIRQTIRLGPSPGKTVYKKVKFGEGGTPINCPPDFEPIKPKAHAEGGVSIRICDIGGLDVPKDIPEIGNLVMDEDLEPVRHDLPRKAYYS